MINELSKQIHQNAKDHGFFDEKKNIGEMLCLIHSEVSECLEADRKHLYAKEDATLTEIDLFGYNFEFQNDAEKVDFQSRFKESIKDSFEDELADVMIRCMDLAAFKGIDLEYHIKMKMMYNVLRPHKHGKKY